MTCPNPENPRIRFGIAGWFAPPRCKINASSCLRRALICPNKMRQSAE